MSVSGSALSFFLPASACLSEAHCFLSYAGDVVYIMVPPTTPKATCDGLVVGMRHALDEHLRGFARSGINLRDGYIV